jgi:hypothetical protein
MRSICLAATLLVPLVLVAQDVKRPILSSHDRVDGPLGGEYHVEDLQVFADGKVQYVEEGTKTMGDKPERSVFEATIGSDEMGRLAELLDSREIRSLPKKVSSKTRPIDFFWQKSLEINRPDKTQKIQIENFYPFLNVHQPVYPTALIKLECSLQNIESEAAKRPRPKDEDDWCGAIRDQSGPAKTECRDDAAQARIVAGEGWGPVRIGAALQAVDDFLGDGQSRNKYSDGYFKDYVPKGVQVSFENASNKVHAIYFYNGQRDKQEFGIFCGRTDTGVNWQSSIDEVKKVYGHPTAAYSGTDGGGTWQRLVFAGIDFRFENEKLVRVGIPGN